MSHTSFSEELIFNEINPYQGDERAEQYYRTGLCYENFGCSPTIQRGIPGKGTDGFETIEVQRIYNNNNEVELNEENENQRISKYFEDSSSMLDINQEDSYDMHLQTQGINIGKAQQIFPQTTDFQTKSIPEFQKYFNLKNPSEQERDKATIKIKLTKNPKDSPLRAAAPPPEARNSKKKTGTPRKRGRREKDKELPTSEIPKSKEKYHGKNSTDNMLRKIKVHFHKFIYNFLNKLIYFVYNRNQRFRIRKISSSNTADINIKSNRELIQQKLYDFLSQDLGEKYVFKDQNRKNLENLCSTKNRKEVILRLLQISYGDFYKISFIGGQNPLPEIPESSTIINEVLKDKDVLTLEKFIKNKIELAGIEKGSPEENYWLVLKNVAENSYLKYIKNGKIKQKGV